MGERLTLWAYRCNLNGFERALEAAVTTFRCKILWGRKPEREEHDCRIASTVSVQDLYLDYMGGLEQKIAESVGRTLDVPWIVLMISEGSLWEYVLFHGASCIDRFSVAPEYWDDDPDFISLHRGNSELLARTWGVPKVAIDRYLRNWGMRNLVDDEFEFTLHGKAYETDKYQYGDIWQMIDFLHALGGKDPTNILAYASQHAIRVPAGGAKGVAS